MRFLLRQLIYRLKNVQKSNYTHGGNTGDVFARRSHPSLLSNKKKWAGRHYIFQKMKGCSSTTIIWLLFAFLVIFPLYTKYREKLNFFCNKYIKWKKDPSHYKPNWTFFFTYKWDHFLSYFISLNSGSLSFITILVSILKIFYKNTKKNLKICWYIVCLLALKKWTLNLS